MATDPRPRRREDFHIAVLCALQLEYNAATLAFDEFFDEEGDKFGRARGDPNTYTTGRIGKYNVVMALLPSMGTTTSAAAMASFRSSYTELKLALLVGICGGVPRPGTEREILLGDVIISKTVVQYDFGRQLPHHFKPKDTLDDILGRPNKDIRSLLNKLETERASDYLQRRTNEILIQIQQTAARAGRRGTRYPHPGAAQDRLFDPDYVHRHPDNEGCGCDDSWVCDTAPDASCIELGCDLAYLIPRKRLDMKKKRKRKGTVTKAQEPRILIGRVGSGNTVLKSGAHRDSIAQKHDLVAFEMEAAGAWDEVPCVVVKGVCDYADSHKNKKWQTFAAATAASTMKALLEQYIQTDSPEGPRVEFTTQRNNQILRWISEEPYEQHHKQTKIEVLEGTGKWLMDDPVFQKWNNETVSSILWLHGIPGSGKSKLTSIVVEDAKQASQTALVYFYCSRNPAESARSDPAKIAASIARQLARPRAGGDVLDAAVKAYSTVEKTGFASQSPTLGESQDLIHKLLESYKDQTVRIVIDALDECNEATRASLLQLLESLLKAPALLKIFVSSRDDQDIVYNLRHYKNLFISSERNSEDIDHFVRFETRRLIETNSLLRGSVRKEELRDKIISELTSKAHGMFRWASLHIQELCRQATDAAIEERLVKMPRTLEGLYQEILDKIENRDAAVDREMAKTVFSWLLCAQEQLKSDVFLEVVFGSTSAISRDQLLELCNNLVLFDEPLDVFRFSHLSVREFLEGQRAYQPVAAHALAAERCLLNLTSIPLEIAMLKPSLEYSCLYWADHAQAASQEKQPRLNKSLADFFSGDQDPCSSFYRWQKVVKSVILDRHQYSDHGLKLRAAMSYTSSCLLVISVFDLSGILSANRWIELAKAQPKNLNGATHEEVAVRYGSIRTLEWHFDNEIPFALTRKIVIAAVAGGENAAQVMFLLLKNRGSEIQITEAVVRTAVSNEQRGDKILQLLFEQRGDEIQVTDRVVSAAVQNETKAVDITSLLFKQRGSEIRITRKIVLAAVQNETKAVEITSLLFKQRGSEILITREIVLAAIRNYKSGTGVMKLLLEERGDEIDISAQVLLSAAGYNEGKIRYLWCFDSILSLLIAERGSQIHVTEQFIKDVVQFQGISARVMKLLLNECEDEFHFTEWLIEAISPAPNNKTELMALLLDRFKPQITDGQLETAVSSYDGTIVRRLIELSDDGIKVTSDIAMAAVQNWDHGKEVMTLLLDKYGSELHITQQVIKAAVQNRFDGARVMDLLFDRCGTEIQITEEIVRVAAYSSAEVMELLFDRRGDEVRITKQIIEVAAMQSNRGAKILATLLKRRGHEFHVTERVLTCAAADSSRRPRYEAGLLEILLDQRMEEVQLTAGVVSAAAGNNSYGVRHMTLLLDRCGDDVPITEEVLHAAACNQGCGDQVMAILLGSHKNSIRITEAVVETAVQNERCGNRVMAVLFGELGDDTPITEQALLYAVENETCGDKVMEAVLEKCGGTLQITTEVVNSAIGNRGCGYSILETLLDRYGDSIPITEETLQYAVCDLECYDMTVALLLRRNRDIKITRDVLWDALWNPKYEDKLIAAMFDRCRDGDADDLGCKYSMALEVASYLGRDEIVQMCIDNNADVNFQGGGQLASALQAASFRGNTNTVQLLLDHKADVNAYGGHFGGSLQAAAASGHVAVVSLLCDKYGPDLDCKNPRNGRTALSYAAGNGYKSIVKLLLTDDRVTPSSQDYLGRTPLFWAAQEGYSAIVRVLVTRDPLVSDLADHYGSTPLSVAARWGHIAVVRILLAIKSVNIDSRDCFGRTPLCWASRRDLPEVSQLLLETAKQRGIPLGDDQVAPKDTIPYDLSARCCAICTFSISKDYAYHHCPDCNFGDFDICGGCYNQGGRCLEASHELVSEASWEKGSTSTESMCSSL